MIAIISLFIRMWLYTYWADYKNSKEYYLKLMELQDYANNKDKPAEERTGSKFGSPSKIIPESEMQRRINTAEEKAYWDKKEAKRIAKIAAYSGPKTNFQKFVSLIFTTEFFVEFIILAIHPFPGYEVRYDIPVIDMLITKSVYLPVTYLLSDFLFAFMFFRVYFLIRTIMNFCAFSELYSKRVCKKHGFESNTAFCLKALIKKSPGDTILVITVISVCWLSYVLRIFER
jgi:hypothetical protein